MNKTLMLISKLFILILCIIAILTIIRGTHEFVHYIEARSQGAVVEVFCVFGFYDESEDFFKHFNPFSNNTIGYVLGDFEYSETKAYIISHIVGAILIVLFVYAYFIVPYKK